MNISQKANTERKYFTAAGPSTGVTFNVVFEEACFP